MYAVTVSTISLDMLNLIARRGSARSAQALGAFSGDALTTGDTAARLVSLTDIPMLGGDPETPVAGLYLGMEGDLAGSVLALFTLDDARILLTALMLEPEDDNFDELALSALGEAGNIIVSAFLAELEPLCGLQVLPTPPNVVIEMRGAILISAVLPVVGASGEVLLIDAEIVPAQATDQPSAACAMFFLPTPDSWTILSRALQPHASDDASRKGSA